MAWRLSRREDKMQRTNDYLIKKQLSWTYNQKVKPLYLFVEDLILQMAGHAKVINCFDLYLIGKWPYVNKSSYSSGYLYCWSGSEKLMPHINAKSLNLYYP